MVDLLKNFRRGSRRVAGTNDDDDAGTVAVVFAALSPHNLNPTPGFAPKRIQEIARQALDAIGSPELPVRVFDPTEWKSKPWKRSAYNVDDVRGPVIRRAARKLKELGLPKPAIKKFRTSASTTLFQGPGTRVYLAGLLEKGSLDIGPLQDANSHAEQEQERTAASEKMSIESPAEDIADEVQTIILAYWTQDPKLPWFSVRCRFDSLLEAKYAVELRKRFDVDGAPVVWVYPDEWPGVLVPLEDETESDLYFRRIVAAAVAWREVAVDQLVSLVSGLSFETTDLEEVGLILFTAPLRTYAGLTLPVVGGRPATEHMGPAMWLAIKDMGSLVHIRGDGRPALFVFEYPGLGDGYERQITGEIETALAGSQGVCAIRQGELDTGPGGAEAVVDDLREVRDGGWIFMTHRPDGPLRTFGRQGAFEAYAVLVWTDRDENIERLHARWREVIPHAYLGYLSSPYPVTLPWLYDAFDDMSLVASGTFNDGEHSPPP